MTQRIIAYGYGRVSTGKQEVSIEVQQQTVKAFYDFRLKPMGVEWGGWYADSAVSGSTKLAERVAGKALLERLRGGDHVMFAKMDRAFRSAVDQALTLDWFLKKGVMPHFLDSGIDATTMTGKLVLGILALVAEWERSRISERTADGHRARLSRGERVSYWPNLGYKWAKRGNKEVLVPCHETLLVMKRIYELYVCDGYTLEDISMKLRLNGVSSKGLYKWFPRKVLNYVNAYKKLLAEGKLPVGARPGENPSGSITLSDSQPTTAHTPSGVTLPPATPAGDNCST